MNHKRYATVLDIAGSPLVEKAPASRYENYCEGYFATDSAQYLLGVSLKCGLVDNHLTCPGSTLLDEINAFDTAEVSGTNLGQLNVITVSSFCGPQGMIWGYDVCQPAGGHELIGSASRAGKRADLYDLAGLTMPFTRLIGTVDDKRFPFMPGSHVPAAMKSKTVRESGTLYAALALGIPEDRRSQACLMMENTGFCPGEGDWSGHRQRIIQCQAQSVLAIGENQRVGYSRIFVGVSSVVVGPNQTGCALAMAPYFRLARNAFLEDRDLSDLTIDEWEAEARGRFLPNWQ